MKYLRNSLPLILAILSVGWTALNSDPLFEEVPSQSSGITWVHVNAMSDERHLPESVGPGGAFFDYNNDGWMDIYLVNSGPSDFYRPRQPLRNALYKNNRDGTFTDVTVSAGGQGGTFGMGVAAGDYNNDGHTDLFITSYGKNILYRNQGDGTFRDVSDKAGLRAPGWTTSAVWFDYDNDGLLDLFACSYVDYSLEKSVFCGDDTLGKRFYCIPTRFKPTASLLFRNRGDETFEPASEKTEIGRNLGKALGVVATDLNNDRQIDLFVANDTVQNFLFVNRGQNRWEEIGLSSEVGYSLDGEARSGMGADAADFDGDGGQDLFVANIDGEMFALYQNNQDETFRDVSFNHGIAQATRLLSGWGLKFFDFDNSGTMDLFLANGHPNDRIELYSNLVKYKEPLLLFQNDGQRLRDISREAGPVFSKSFSARGLAVGDYNNDGRADVLVTTNGGTPVLVRNNAGQDHHWLGLKLEGNKSNRDSIGTRFTWSAGGVVRSRLRNGGGSYLSSHDPREILGIGQATKVDWLEIQWAAPSDRIERLTNVPIDRYVTVVEGKGLK